MAQNRIIPPTEYAPGFYEIELNQLPGNSIGAEIIFTRPADMPAGNLAEINVYMSRDNRVTWLHVMGTTLSGGVIHNKDGSIATTSTMRFTWPGEAGPNGRVMLKGDDIKITANVLQTFTTGITLNSISTTAGN